jgi:hypothetical protein
MIFRTPLFFVALASLGLVACSSDTTDGSTDDDQRAFEESEIRACSESYARRYFVTLEGRGCVDVPGNRGSWVAAPLEDSADSVCTMSWQGEKFSRADTDALRAFVKQMDVMTAACGSNADLHVGTLTPITTFDRVIFAGANGCDVCGKVARHRRVMSGGGLGYRRV